MGRRGIDVGLDNDRDGLLWLHRFQWLRPPELGRLLWPNNDRAQENGERIARKWTAQRFIIRRTLPHRAGSALVLSNRGAQFLRDEIGVDAVDGKDWGETDAQRGGAWSPPRSWRHDLKAAGLLSLLHSRGCRIVSERQVRSWYPELEKYPDGLAYSEETVMWIEVENARKTGPHLTKMCEVLSRVAGNRFPGLAETSSLQAVVAFAGEALDERGSQLDHRRRVLAGIQRVAQVDVPLRLLQLRIRNFGVESIDSDDLVLVPADAVTRLLGKIEWERDDIEHRSRAYWQHRYLECSRKPSGEWQWRVILDDDNETELDCGVAANATESKRASVEALLLHEVR